MIRWLKSMLCGLFGLEALCLLPAFPLSVLMLIRTRHKHAGNPHFDPSYFLIGGIALAAFSLLFGIAWWANQNQKGYARALAIEASIANLLLAALLYPSIRLTLFTAYWILPVSGLIGIYVFSRKSTVVKAPRPVSLRANPGDGTHTLLNKSSWLILSLAGWAAIAWWLRWKHAHYIPDHDGLWFYSLLAFVLVGTVTAHELGHALAGRLLGMKLGSFVAGPFQWQFRQGRWRFQFKPSAIFVAQGAVGLLPATLHVPRGRHVIAIAAGPFANLLIASASFIAVPYVAAGQWMAVLALVGAYNLAIGLSNLIPFRTGNTYSDGTRIFQMLSGSPFAEIHQALTMAGSSFVTSIRPSQFDLSLLRRAALWAPRSSQRMLLHLLAQECLVDRGHYDPAIEELKLAEADFLDGDEDLPSEILSSLTFGNAFLKCDRISARAWWQRRLEKHPDCSTASDWLAYCSLHWIEGDLPEAQNCWHKGSALANQLPQVGAYDFVRRSFRLMHKRLEEASLRFSTFQESQHAGGQEPSFEVPTKENIAAEAVLQAVG